MTDPNFRSGVKTISPPWLQGKWGERYLFGLCVPVDATMEALVQGTQAKFPGVGTSEALPLIGADFLLERMSQESDAAYIARLRRSWAAWRIAGTPFSVLSTIQAYFVSFLDATHTVLPRLRYVVNGRDENGALVSDWMTLDADGTLSFYRAGPATGGSNWNWDGVVDIARFWVIIYPGLDFNDGPKWNAFNWNDGTLWTGSNTLNRVADVRAIIKKWKAAGSGCGGSDLSGQQQTEAGIIFPNDSSMFDPTSPPGPPMPSGNWNNPVNRDPNALYYPGTI